MSLPPITSITPVSTEPSEAKEFNELFIEQLILSTQPSGSQSAVVRLKPYNYETGELAPIGLAQHTIRIDDVATEAARVPILAQAMGYLVVSVDLLQKEHDLLELIAAAEAAEEPTDTLEAQLAQVHTGMGIT